MFMSHVAFHGFSYVVASRQRSITNMSRERHRDSLPSQIEGGYLSSKKSLDHRSSFPFLHGDTISFF